MSDLMDHPFITSGDNNENGDIKLTILDCEDYQKDMIRMSEVS
jgi:hypothetical protein